MSSDFHPARTLGFLVGTVLTLWCYALTGVLLWRGLSADVELSTLGPYLASTFFFGLGCVFAYWTYSCFTLRYYVTRNGLTIRWGDIHQLIPMNRIERLVPGRERPAPKVNGVSWLGHHVGHGEVEGLGDVLFYATHRTHEELLYVVTHTQTYALSVPDEVRFAEDLQGHQKLGQVISLPQVTERTAIAAQPFWHDPIARALALCAAIAFAAMLGYVFHQYPGLPDSIPFAYPPLSGITRVDSKSELLAIPTTGIGMLAVTLVLGYALHAWERAVGYVLFLAGIGAQLVLLSAAIVTLNQ